MTPNPTDLSAYASDVWVKALLIHQASLRRGSVSPVYSSCTSDFIFTLMNKIDYLSRLHGRPPDKILAAASKALSHIQDAIAELNEEIQANTP
jgi:hypothetical protein